MSGEIILNCTVCGDEIQSDIGQCSKCKEIESNVQVLTPEEKQEFEGITIEQETDKRNEEQYKYQSFNENQRIYVKHINIGGNMGFFTKMILAICFIGLIVIALPIALVLISVVGFFLYIMRR
jgi:hypothetical protein